MNDNDDDDNAARGANYNSARSALLLTTTTSLGLLLPRNTGGRIVASWLKNSRTNDDSNIGFARRGGRKKNQASTGFRNRKADSSLVAVSSVRKPFSSSRQYHDAVRMGFLVAMVTAVVDTVRRGWDFFVSASRGSVVRPTNAVRDL